MSFITLILFIPKKKKLRPKNKIENFSEFNEKKKNSSEKYIAAVERKFKG